MSSSNIYVILYSLIIRICIDSEKLSREIRFIHCDQCQLILLCIETNWFSVCVQECEQFVGLHYIERIF
jgi:hypothetical protein